MADADLSVVVARVRAQAIWHVTDIGDLEDLCAAAEQLAEARAELEKYKSARTGVVAVVELSCSLAESETKRAELRAQLSAQGEEAARLRAALNAARPYMECIPTCGATISRGRNACTCGMRDVFNQSTDVLVDSARAALAAGAKENEG